MIAPYTSTFALLDVKRGRHRLAARLNKGDPVPVVIRGFVTRPWGHDDGVSTEFEIEVTALEIEEPVDGST
jgi:hypothetical protein